MHESDEVSFLDADFLEEVKDIFPYMSLHSQTKRGKFVEELRQDGVSVYIIHANDIVAKAYLASESGESMKIEKMEESKFDKKTLTVNAVVDLQREVAKRSPK